MKKPFELSTKKIELVKARLQKKHAINDDTPTPLSSTGILPRSDKTWFPLSYIQQRMWFLHQLDPANPQHHITTAWRIRGPLDRVCLEQSLQNLVVRHEMLRSVFYDREGQPVQQLISSPTLPLRRVDLSKLSRYDGEQQLQQMVQQEAQRPFQLANGPLLRALLICTDKDTYVLQLTLHQIISDRQSLTLLGHELALLYNAAIADASAPLRDIAIQYADYAVWQQQWLRSKACEQQLALWKQRLADRTSTLELPADYLRLSAHRSPLKILQSLITPILTSKLQEFCQRELVTPALVFQAALQILLYRYTSQQDMIIGTFSTPRSHPEIESVIGPITTMTAIPMCLSGNLSIHDVLGQVLEANKQVTGYQDLPFELVMETTQPEYDISRSALFQVVFAYERIFGGASFAGIHLEPFPIEQEEAQYDIGLRVFEGTQWQIVSIEYDSGLFAPSTIQRLSGHYQMVLEGILANPDQRIAEIKLVTEQEWQQIVIEWNATAVTAQDHHCIHTLFEEQVIRTPQKVAIVYEGASLTYYELNQRANQLAHFLMALGVKDEMLVGIAVERSLEMVIGLLAIMKAGGAYVPLDPTNPKERLAYMFNDANLSVLLTQKHLMNSLPTFAGSIVCFELDQQRIAIHNTTNPAHTVLPEHLAYVIYTSGSTGNPKGAMNEHRAVCNRLLWMKDAYQMDSQDSVLQKSPYSFDVSVGELFCPLISGSRLVMARPEGHKDPSYLVEVIIREAITTIHFVPSMLNLFLEEPGIEHCTSLKRVMCSGEALSYKIQERFFARCPAALHNLYGPTETAVEVTFWDCRRDDSQKRVPIGRPIANTQLYILDEQLQIVPIGVPGELFIGGLPVGRGYLNRAELTKERFIPDPFSQQPGARLYKTGDLVRYRADGTIDYLGRRDHQVKIHGHRIELSEIQTVMLRHPLVQQAVVIFHTYQSDNTQLVAYFIPNQSTENMQAVPGAYGLINSQQIILQVRDFLRAQLPDYMVPSAFVVMDVFPLTHSGKLDTRSLPPPAYTQTRLSLSDDFVAPRSQVEQVLANICMEVLDVPQIGIHDNFFELGGNSLKAIQLLSRIRHELHIERSLTELFRSPTIAELAVHIESRLLSGTQEQLPPPLCAVPRDRDLPLSFAQQRLWFLDQLDPGQATYNIPLQLQLTGDLHIVALQQSLREIVRRHEILRTVFANIDGRPIQKIIAMPDIPLTIIDLREMAPHLRDQRKEQWIIQEAQTPFDLAQGPLLRFHLLRLQEQSHLLLLTMHHIISDGWSIGVMGQELAALYNAFVNQQPSPLPPLPIQYADYAVWQRQRLQGSHLEQHLLYWKHFLAGRPTSLELPLDHPRPPVRTFHGRTSHFHLSAEVSQQVHQLSKRLGATLFMTLLSAFSVLLMRTTAQDDLVIGTVVANRTHPQIENLIGFFVNTLALRIDLSGDPSFQELIHRLQEIALERL